MRNFLCVLALLTIAAIGVQAANCTNANCYWTRAGNFTVQNNTPNDGVILLWEDPNVAGPPSYEAYTCSSLRGLDPQTDPQQCYNGDHSIEKWKLVGFSSACSNVGNPTVHEVSGGTAVGVAPVGTTLYCDCYPDEHD